MKNDGAKLRRTPQVWSGDDKINNMENKLHGSSDEPEVKQVVAVLSKGSIVDVVGKVVSLQNNNVEMYRVKFFKEDKIHKDEWDYNDYNYNKSTGQCKNLEDHSAYWDKDRLACWSEERIELEDKMYYYYILADDIIGNLEAIKDVEFVSPLLDKPKSGNLKEVLKTIVKKDLGVSELSSVCSKLDNDWKCEFCKNTNVVCSNESLSSWQCDSAAVKFEDMKKKVTDLKNNSKYIVANVGCAKDTKWGAWDGIKYVTIYGYDRSLKFTVRRYSLLDEMLKEYNRTGFFYINDPSLMRYGMADSEQMLKQSSEFVILTKKN